MARQNITVNPRWIVEGDFGFLSGYQQGQVLLSLPVEDRPSAIFCHSDEMAIGLLKAARDASIDVPEQLSVIGFDNIGFSEYCQPELTTVSQPREDIGRCAMRLLLDILRKKQAPRQQVLNTHLIVRSSTAQAPKH
jgi:LacI family repressor for deo operon, udp, cdd, tsx, nupC, and nupG